MEIMLNTLTPEVFLELYRSVGWEPPCIEQVNQALKNTIAAFTAFENEQTVGMVRLIGDGAMSFFILRILQWFLLINQKESALF